MRTRTLGRALAALAVVTTVAAAAGCGFERQAPYAGTRVPDVGPWQDLGPLTVCHLGRRIVAPSLGDAGVCLAASDGAGASCSGDSDCKSRERCICGACEVTACDSADECGPANGPFVCTFADRRCDRSCAVDSDCAGGERCLPGFHVCRGTCAANSDCQHGERCQTSTGLCTTSVCAVDGDCSGGGQCWPERTGALLAEPSPLVTAAGVDLWLERTDGDGVARIWHGRGDGTQFTLDGDALFAGAAPSVARLADGSYAMIFASGADLFAARSPDGAAWSAPSPALSSARQPSLVVQPDGTALLWAVDSDGNITRFTDSADLVFASPLVALTPAAASTPAWPDVDALASPFVEPYVDVDHTPHLRLWFAGHGTESGPSIQFGVPTPSPPDYSIGLAVSADGASFIPDAFDPVFDRTTDFINHPSELEPAVVSLGDRWLLYYRRAKPDGSAAETLAVAVSPVAPR